MIRKMSLLLATLSLVVALSLHTAASSSSSSSLHSYNVGDPVPLFVNKVGPFHNPSETYQYYDLPFCRPPGLVSWKKETLGEVLNGDRLAASLYSISFRVDREGETLCEVPLGKDQVGKFRDAIADDFYFQMQLDGLPFWGFIGRIDDLSSIKSDRGGYVKYYLFTHVAFDVLYNGDRVIEVRAFSDPNYAVDVTDDVDVDVKFTYSVTWNMTSEKFENRMERYSRAALVPVRRRVRWFSFLNGVVVVLLCLGLLGMLFMRRLKNDLMRGGSGNEEGEDKEVGWKYIHGDVFRCPHNLPLFCAVLGTGTQLLTMVLLLFVLAFVGVLYPYNHGLLCTSLILAYSVTSFVGGYTSSSFYCQFAETGWETAVLLSGILYLGPLFVILSTLNTVAVFHGATAAIPFSTFMAILVIYIFLTLPLLVLGGVLGYCFRSVFQAPSAVKRSAREIPTSGWYRGTPGQMFLGGLVPFSVIILELHHLFASLWGFKIHTLPSILFVAFIIVILLTATLSVGMTYIQLSVEDHQWWWRSMLHGGSPAIFMFIYCIYFFTRSDMSGSMQLSFYFGYNACLCYAVFLMLSAISFRVSFFFVRKIYSAVKSE